VFSNLFNNGEKQYKPAHKLRIATLNCPGIAAITNTGRRKRKTLRQYCKRNRIYILAMQETHTTEELSKLSSLFSFRTYSSTTSSSEGGVAFVIFNPKIKMLAATDAKDSNMYSIRIQYMDRKFTVVNFYSPPSKSQQQLLFKKYLGLWDNEKQILFVGDWNFLEDPKSDSIGRNPEDALQPPPAFHYLKQVHQLIDVTTLRPPKNHMTRWNVNHSSGARLDRIYSSANMANWVIATKNEAIPCVLKSSIRNTISDHNIVTLTISATNTPRGEGYWKLNTQALKSLVVQQKIASIIEEYILNINKRPAKFIQYENLKSQIRMYLRDWSEARAKK